MKTSGWVVGWLAVVGLSGCGEDAPTPPARGSVGAVISRAPVADAPIAPPQLTNLPVALSGELDDDARRRASEGPAPEALAEPTRALPRATPDALLETTLSALFDGDVAALARLQFSRAARPQLDQEDARAIERRFLAPSTQPFWARIQAAHAEGRVEIEQTSPTEARIRIAVDGAVGGYTIHVHKEDDGWYLSG